MWRKAISCQFADVMVAIGFDLLVLLTDGGRTSGVVISIARRSGGHGGTFLPMAGGGRTSLAAGLSSAV
jgi:hypothetical protein